MIYYEIFRSKAEQFTPSLRLFSLLSGFGCNDVYGCCCRCWCWRTLDVTQCLQYSFIWYSVDINVKHIHCIHWIRFRHLFFSSFYYYRITFFLSVSLSLCLPFSHFCFIRIFTAKLHSIRIYLLFKYKQTSGVILTHTQRETSTRTTVFIILFARQLQFKTFPHCLQTLQSISV